MQLGIKWKKRLPILAWLPCYSLAKLQKDCIAGVTVGLMVIPQGLAYAIISELPPEYGLYSSLVCGLVYAVLGSCKDITQGPTAITALMVARYASRVDRVTYAVALSFFSGIILLLMGVFSLGFVVRIIPLPVISGFTSSAAIAIACGQFANILGLKDISRDFIPGMVGIATHIRESNLMDLFLSFTCAVMLFFLGYVHTLTALWPEEEMEQTMLKKSLRKFVWILCTARNAVMVFASALICLGFHQNGMTPFTLIGEVRKGLPEVRMPLLTACDGNRTVSTQEMITEIGLGGFVMLPMISFVTNIAIAQAFARKYKYEIDATQELLALGFTNFFSSFFSAFPITGSFSRSSVNAASGVATQMGGVFTSLLVLLALTVLIPFFKFIPTATLASIIITSVLHMVDFQIILKIWRTNRIDLIPYFATFLACFHHLETGIILGVATALMIFLYRRMFPVVQVEGNLMCNINLHGGMSYMSINHVISTVRTTLISESRPGCIAFDCTTLFDCDFTVAEGLVQLYNECIDQEVKLIFYNVEFNVQRSLLHCGMPNAVFQSDLTEEFYGLLNS